MNSYSSIFTALLQFAVIIVCTALCMAPGPGSVCEDVRNVSARVLAGSSYCSYSRGQKKVDVPFPCNGTLRLRLLETLTCVFASSFRRNY